MAGPPRAQPADDRADALIATLQLQPHPEGGFFREVFRSAHEVSPRDARGARRALTSIDFLLRRGQFSAWHRVASDEVWHLLEGGPLRLWLMPPGLDAVHAVTLGQATPGQAPRYVVPANWWQAAEAIDGFAYCGATVGPGFEFADFSFLRERGAARQALEAMRPELLRLL